MTVDVDEIQPHAAFAFPAGLFAILAIGQALIAFQMALSACETSCPHSLRLAGAGWGSLLAISGSYFGVLLRDRTVVDGS